MEEASRVCSLLCLSLLLATLSESCSDVTAERLISGSRYRVQDKFFIADSVDDKYTPQQARLNGDSWCSSDSLTASSEPPWLQVTFGMEFNISKIQTGGHDGFYNYYMTRFEVHIGNGTKGSLHPLTISDDSIQPVVFRRKGTYDVEDSVLPSPVITRVLRIVAVGWTPQNQVCLRLEALGCLPSPAPPTILTTATEPNTESSSNSTQATPTTEEISEASSYTSQETPPTEEISEASSYTMQESILVSPQGRSRMVIVGGAVGGGFGLMVALLLLTFAVAAIYIFTRRSAQIQLPDSCEVYSEVTFDNSTFKKIPLQSLCKDTPEHKVDQSLYDDKEVIKKENHLDMRDVPSSIMSNIYEPISASNTVLLDPVQDFNGTLDPQNKGMHGNPLYDKSSEEEFKMEFDQARPSIPSSITLNTYELIPATTAILNEPIPDLMKTINLQDEELYDNPLYDKSCEDDFKMEHLSKPNISLSNNESTIFYEPVQDLNKDLDPQNEGIHDNPLYDKCSEDDFKVEYHLSHPSIASLSTYESTILHEPVDDLNGTLDPQNLGMHDNPFYDKEDFKMEYHQAGPSIPSSITLNTYESISATTTILNESIPDMNETIDLQDEELYDNPLYDKSCEEDFKMKCHLSQPNLFNNESTILYEPVQDLNRKLDPQDQGMHDNPLYDKNCEDDFKMDYHLARPSIPSSIASNTSESIPTITAIHHEPEHINGTVDKYDQKMSNNL